MDLTQFIASHSYLSLYHPERDEALVQKFMGSSPMRVGGLELVYDRSPSFQSLLHAQSDRFVTLLARHSDGELLGMFSLSFAPKYINGKPVSCAYIGDFRTDNSRASSRLWRQDYSKIIEAIKNDSQYGNPKYILTAVLEKNKEAIRSLAQSKKDFGFQYDPLCTVQMVNVYAILPNLIKRNSLIAVRAGRDDMESLRQFLHRSESAKQFGMLVEGVGNAWDWRQKTWDKFSPENFLIIKDRNQNIIACTLPWNPSYLKRMRVLAAPRWLDRSFNILNDLGLNLPSVGESIETLYLTHLNISAQVDPQQALYAFLLQAKAIYPRVHMMTFADFNGVSQNMKRLIAQRVGVCLFNVRLSSEEAFAETQNLSFEMALV